MRTAPAALSARAGPGTPSAPSPAPTGLPRRSRANGPICAPGPISAPSRCENEWMQASAATDTPVTEVGDLAVLLWGPLMRGAVVNLG